MVVDLMTYRQPVGCFVMSRRDRSRMHGLTMSRRKVSLCLRLAIVVTCGTTKTNPGPWSNSNSVEPGPLSQGRQSRSTSWRQTTLSTNEHVILVVEPAGEKDLFGHSISLKSDFNKGIADNNSNLSSFSLKTDDVSSVCSELKSENDR
ncbi:hypothetical protein DPMN_123058 [Dreissena polymorpha]|uniref:Uncharacterized protein n=1 Tax=Dreissena polymorpha TaxID=45954 RepID=A0A9D4GTL2_DREPO|nr:hypothetical protein DPMN_123058 [Dreissena polymorpha]